uniref:P17 protein n=1 Tax=Kasama virus TaxID=2755161 RepID=A0A7D5Y4V5_9REOV|nr:P17 protein [Kasama virus]
MSIQPHLVFRMCESSFYEPWVQSGYRPEISFICLRELTYYINVHIPLDHPQRSTACCLVQTPAAWHVSLVRRRSHDPSTPDFCELDCVLRHIRPIPRRLVSRGFSSHIVVHYDRTTQSPAAKRGRRSDFDDEPEHKRLAI